MATDEDRYLATSGDFFMATDTGEGTPRHLTLSADAGHRAPRSAWAFSMLDGDPALTWGFIARDAVVVTYPGRECLPSEVTAGRPR